MKNLYESIVNTTPICAGFNRGVTRTIYKEVELSDVGTILRTSSGTSMNHVFSLTDVGRVLAVSFSDSYFVSNQFGNTFKK